MGNNSVKKVFASLGVVLLVAVLGVAVIFAYGSYKDLELKKEEAKVTENKKIVKTKLPKKNNKIKVQTKQKFKNQQTQIIINIMILTKKPIQMKYEQQKMVKKLKKLRMA